MKDRRHRDPSDEEEPAVTFESPEDGTGEQPGDRWRRAGLVAASGAALMSGGAPEVSADSLDVFDDLTPNDTPNLEPHLPLAAEVEDQVDEVVDTDFPPLDFSVTSMPDDPALAEVDEVMFGAVAEIGGGHVLGGAELATASEAFTATGDMIAPPEPFADHDDPDDDDDLDLTDLDFD